MAAWLYLLLLLFGIAGPPPAPGPRQPVALPTPELHRIAVAVEGAESSFGADKAMWRPNLAGPQGPMQVTAAAAADVGDGDRFDSDDNRRLGRDYLALLFRRYGNWTDAVVAYYWGPGNVDRWLAAGRGRDGLSAPLRAYVQRVMRDFLPEPPPAAAPAFSVRPQAPPAEPPIAEIRNASLRKAYLADRAAISQLRDFLNETQATATAGDPREIMKLLRHVAARPGFVEFAPLRTSRVTAPPSQAALRQIASTLIDKLRAECAAIVIVDQRRTARAR